MDELFEEHLEIAKALFAQRLPYWCDVFLRPADRAFNALSLIHISEPTRPVCSSRMPSSA